MKTQDKITTLIADGPRLFRESLSRALRSSGIDVLGQAENEQALFELLKAQKPDIVIYDYFTSSQKPGTILKMILGVAPEIKLLVLSFQDDPELVDLCITAGAKGFCYKNITDMEAVIDTVEKIASGQTVILTQQPA